MLKKTDFTSTFNIQHSTFEIQHSSHHCRKDSGGASLQKPTLLFFPAMKIFPTNKTPSFLLPGIERSLLIFAVALTASAAWLRGGTKPMLQTPLPWFGALILLGVLTVVYVRNKRDHARTGETGQAAGNRWKRLLTDPITLAGLLFLALLALQSWNAGRHLYFHPLQEQWVYSQPPHPGWPSAINRSESLEMLRWFFPAWALLLAFRHALRDSKEKEATLKILTLNAAVLAVFGIVQFLSGTDAIFWTEPLPCVFFASFGYPNHAGSYFILFAGLAGGLLIQSVNRSPTAPPVKSIILWASSLLLCLVAANLSLCRAAMVMSPVIAGVVGVTLFARIWPNLKPIHKVNTAALSIALLCLCVLFIDMVAGEAIREEWTKQKKDDYISQWVNVPVGRFYMHKAAFEIWRENPWFGVGGWGFRYFLALHLPEEDWAKVHSLGRANAHNDFLQFMAEFGSVGVGLMLVIVSTLGVGIVHNRSWRSPDAVPMIAALLLVVVHSMIDLPFRSPAILYAWLTVAAIQSTKDRPVL